MSVVDGGPPSACSLSWPCSCSPRNAQGDPQDGLGACPEGKPLGHHVTPAPFHPTQDHPEVAGCTGCPVSASVPGPRNGLQPRYLIRAGMRLTILTSITLTASPIGLMRTCCRPSPRALSSADWLGQFRHNPFKAL
jgi:hypothetical protein